MRRTKWAAVAIAVIALGAAGCGTGDAGTEGEVAPMSPRPSGTGPLTREVARTDLDTAAAAAGIPANVPEYAGMNEDAPAGSPRSCGVAFKGFGTETTPVDVARFDAVVRELRKRDWEQSGKRTDRKDVKDGVINQAQVTLKQRGWTTLAEYRTALDGGVITLLSSEDECMKKFGADASAVG
ncbi:hypothetical protein ACGFYQ_39270 [Streptomyces sp. NPDC048258]|uniref:hypothetical protein n=1 Tax=Streptomyces sp. NPDC048258 TaxID=3365527 RepID=UPI0037136993